MDLKQISWICVHSSQMVGKIWHFTLLIWLRHRRAKRVLCFIIFFQRKKKAVDREKKSTIYPKKFTKQYLKERLIHKFSASFCKPISKKSSTKKNNLRGLGSVHYRRLTEVGKSERGEQTDGEGQGQF